MRLIADYHIHSNNCKFRVAKSSIEEIARKANSLGLKSIAITDHGFKHKLAANKKKLFEAREIINKINMSSGTEVLLGIEADILSEDGLIDIDEQTLEIIDVLIIGYHKFIKTDFASYFGRQKGGHEAISLATDAYINAILKYDVDIVAHPGHGVKIDLFRLGKVCAEYDVLMELNNRHCDYSEEDMADLLRSGCSFVVSSDAYAENNIGEVDNVFNLIEKYNIPTERIVNVDFDSSSQSEIEKLIEEDYERYRKVMASKKKKYGDLSDETERRLNEIAKAKGIYQEDENEIDIKEFLSDEDRIMVERAEAYIKKHKKD